MSAAFSRRLRTRKLKAEINVVPYIDVMLVLLVIFMITAPLLNLGVDINLPQSNAKALESKKDPVLITVEKGGSFKLKLPDLGSEQVDAAALGAKLAAFAQANPDLSVVIAGDVDVSYGAIYQAMTYVQAANIDKISLMSKPSEAN
jgi:biopolymer transport protein TolR